MSVFPSTKRHDEAGDLALLDQYRQSGDLAVLGKLYKPYMGLVYGVCLKYLKDEELCKDAVMQIFEELVTKAGKHDIKQFRPWLYVLARNHCLMQLRSGKKMDVINLDDVMENNIIMHPDTEDKEETLTALERCMDKLPAAQKQSVDMFYYNDKCYKEIADETGYSLNEVKSYIQNGKRNLKICLEKNGGR
ncbi:RNA polymerase sigma factor [Mucilaginibacter myungsuensis]|uniref:Sigma-70 family RNA polymerase sigma factor n=1 Tax=Mucilaginibacter myungsuensis TaxID=649104 RepID=A0A929PUU3_9SPHI|nr:sigma-70 family RNA polymerase sigma factor [Mucilaginibacter myungsuensis]MBE9661128.1 sigma-70 family RNA polymerase sigma factor [Mucilaginibacter myungsuensis]MDN3597273.1 sigma-70 family RNA polymerase sigma factor [Mucilaginibacter myungsuensis]